MTETEKLIKEELRFEKYKFNSLTFLKEELKTLYEFILVKLDNENLNNSYKTKVKESMLKKIEKIYSKFYDLGSDNIKEQIKYFSELKNVDSNIEKVILGLAFGFTLLELVKKQKNYQTNLILKAINDNSINKDIFYGVNILNQNKTILGSFSKKLREDVRNKQDIKKIIGWKSVAVLDGRTSSICLKLHNKFYSKEEFKQRENIPDLPPRHLNCRSSVVEIYEKEELEKKEITLDEYFLKNKDEAISILGKDRANLFFEGKIKFNSFLDIGNRLFSLEEIKESLK